MKHRISRKVLMRLIWGAGILPLVLTDVTVAIAANQTLDNPQQLAQASRCPQLRRLIEESSRINSCSQDELSQLLEQLKEVIGNTPATNPEHARSQTQALQKLRLIVSRSESVVIDAQLSVLLEQIRAYLTVASDATSKTLQAKTAAINLFGVIATREIAKADDLSNNASKVLEEILKDQTLFSVDVLSIKDVSEFRARLSSSNANASDENVALFRAQIGVHLAALNAVRDIGQALQFQIVQAAEAAAPSSEVVFSSSLNSIRQLLADSSADSSVSSTLRQYLTEKPEMGRAESESENLFLDIQVATVEALAAITFPENSFIHTDVRDNSHTINDVDRNLELLNQLAAGFSQGSNSDTPNVSSAVRAAAISALEHLGNLPAPFHNWVVSTLKNIAEQHDGGGASVDKSIGINAINVFSRLESQELQRQGQPLDPVVQDATGVAESAPRNIESFNSQNNPPNAYERYLDDLQRAEGVFRVLGSGFEAEEGQELRQSAEVAFQQFYGKDINQLLRAIDKINHSATSSPSDQSEAIRLAAVRALGGISYRRFQDKTQDPDALKKITLFLGESLRSDNSDIRQRTAYALGQVASYWPGSLQEAYEQGTDYRRAIKRGNEKTVLDSLLLGLNDRGFRKNQEKSENIIATVAHALSRYGITLDQNQKKDELLDQVITSSTFSQSQGQLQTLKACLKAIIAPDASTLDEFTQVDKVWQERASNFEKDCPHLIPETILPGLEKPDTDRAAIGAAFALGQIGISDGQAMSPEINSVQLEECQTIEDLLWSMQMRDLAMSDGRPPFLQQQKTDNVRDSITSYTLAQIDAREHGLIARLLDAVTANISTSDSPEDVHRERFTPEKCLEANQDIDYLSDYSTRAAVIGALDQIGLEGVSLQSFVRRTRRLLAQDADPSNSVQAAVTSVIERSNNKADTQLQDLLDNLQNLDTMQTAGGKEQLDIDNMRELMRLVRSDRQKFLENVDSSGNLLTATQDFDEAGYLLAFPYDSLLACAGANYTLEAIGISSDLAVKQRMEHIYVYPKPYDYICASNLSITEPWPAVADEPPLVEQLSLMKRGAIAALGQIDAEYERLPEVVNCLANLAGDRNNLTPTADCPMRFSKLSFEAKDRQADWCLTDFQIEEFQRQQEQNGQFQYYRLFDSLEYGLTDKFQDRLPEHRLPEHECPTTAQLNEERLPERLPNANQLPAEYQAEGWGLTAQRYNSLRQDLKKPAIEALGQIALRESGDKALCTLAITQSAATYCNRQLPTSTSFNRLRMLRLNQLESIALNLQGTDDDAKQKLKTVVREFLLPILTMNSSKDEKSLRDQALDTLSKLDSAVFNGLSANTKIKLLENLGFTNDQSHLDSIVNRCVSTDTDLLQREKLCIGLTSLLGKLQLDYLDKGNPSVTRAINTLRKKLVDDSQSAIIRASAITAINQVDLGDVSTQIQLLSRLSRLQTDEPRVVDQIIQAFLRSEPNEAIPVLTTLLRGNDDEAWQAALAIRLLGQYTYFTLETIEQIEDSMVLDDFSSASWQTALNAPVLISALLARLNGELGSNADLSKQILYALGELRTDSREANRTLRAILDNSSDTSVRATAAYALGKVGNQHPEIGTLALPALNQIVLDETARIPNYLNSDERQKLRELRAAAAYAIAQMGTHAYETQVGIDPQSVLDSLLTTYQTALDEESDVLSAIMLYSLGSLGFEDNRIANLYADSLQPGKPFNIRVIAATYARELLGQVREHDDSRIDSDGLPDLSQYQEFSSFSDGYDPRFPKWNQNLIDALIEATKAPEITIRQNAVMALGNRPNFINAPEMNASYRREILEVLADVFWNEREYPSVRLEAGVSIKKLSRDVLTDAFETTFTDLKILEELRLGSSFIQSEVRSPEQALFAVRSASLIAALDAAVGADILLLILDALRAPTNTSDVRTQIAISSRRRPPICRFVRRFIPRCR